MRIIGIDYGTKRVGVAVSDEAGQFALPHSVIVNTSGAKTATASRLLGEIEAIATANGTKEVVIGDSKDYKGEANKIMPAIHELKGQLESKGFVVHLEPEFMTSVQAGRLQGKNAKSDASAAAIILQSYLDKTHNT